MPLKVGGLLFFYLAKVGTQKLSLLVRAANLLVPITFFIVSAAVGAIPAQAQQYSEINTAAAAINASAANANTAAPSMAERLTKARAMIAARQLPNAAFELEKIKKEAGDDALQSVARTMLIGVYVEIPDYAKASVLLEETFARNKTRKKGADNIYLPVAAQVIKGAQNQLERYKKLGFNLADPKLPAEAVADLTRWRKMLETVVEQTKQLSINEKKNSESLAVLEEAAATRGALARDQYEAAAWRNVVADTRELIAQSQTKITDVDGSSLDLKNIAELKLPTGNENPASNANSGQSTTNQTQSGASVFTPAKSEEQIIIAAAPPKINAAQSATTNNNALGNKNTESNLPPSVVAEKKVESSPVAPENTVAESGDEKTLLKYDSLVEFAVRKFPPMYPPTAKNARISGIIKIEIVVDEQGSVAEVKAAEGPEILRRAALDAVKRWKFKPAVKDGQPVRMVGYVNFNFTL
jgi:TonB family protein